MPVLGNNTIGSNNSISSRWYAGMFTATEDGEITDFAAYMASTGIGTNFRFVIYSDNSGYPSSTVLAQSAIISGFDTTLKWWTGAINYIFAASEVLHFYIMSDDQIDYYYSNGTGILQFIETTEDFNVWGIGTPPTPPTSVVPAYDFIPSFYVNYDKILEGSKFYYRRFHKPALFKPGNAR